VTTNLTQQFGECIFERDGLGLLQRVKYSSEWKQIQRDPRRGSIDRRATIERRKLPESVCVPVREKRKAQRRDLRRLRCDFCRKDFTDVPSLVDHLPCKAIHELVQLGFWDFIAGIARNGGPSTQSLCLRATSIRPRMLCSLRCRGWVGTNLGTLKWGEPLC
jgi:hypothetical protein